MVISLCEVGKLLEPLLTVACCGLGESEFVEPLLGVVDVGGNTSVRCFCDVLGGNVEWQTACFLVGLNESAVEKPTESFLEWFVCQKWDFETDVGWRWFHLSVC